MATMDGNEAVASVAHRVSEIVAVYPITPSSPIGELCEEWSAKGRSNIWGTVPKVAELQSEGGAAGAIHGALQTGALTTTFTASQGLLLMLPNMYKIAGELSAFAMHVTARTVATHALSIFGDHSDVMAARQTGFALLCSGSVQEAHDLAAIAHVATLKSRLPFLHFLDGFRTSHEVAKIELLDDDDLRRLLPDDLVASHRGRALTPDRPVVRGTAQNPDVFFQGREACNGFYQLCPDATQAAMDEFAALTGREYHPFDYVGHPLAERVIVMMGSGAEVAHEAVEHLVSRGEKVGVVKVRLYRPFSVSHFAGALPSSARSIAVLDRTKEPGAPGEPLYQDVVTALRELDELNPRGVRVIAGRYGLSSKEFTPAMAKAVLDELGRPQPRRHFTVGIKDDVSHLSLRVDPTFDTELPDVVRAISYGLGGAGTVGANKNTIKIIGEDTPNYAQGYFVYDSRRSGGVTISHLRFGPRPIRSSYLVTRASFVACHEFAFLDKYDVLQAAAPGASFLLNAPYAKDQVWGRLPREVQAQIVDKGLKLFVIDANRLAKGRGIGLRINTIMQTCFFAITGVLPRVQAMAHIKRSIEATYGRKGADVVQRNFQAVDATLERLQEVTVPGTLDGHPRPPPVPESAPDFVRHVTAPMLAGKGDLLPVSALPVDGTWPTGTTRWEKRRIAHEIPYWDAGFCSQCNRCALVCPHGAIRVKFYPREALSRAPTTFKYADYGSADAKGAKFTVQVAPEDCTGCALCVEVCPAESKTELGKKALVMAAMEPLRAQERENFEFFLTLPDADRRKLRLDLKSTQFLEPLFEFSGACAGCGQTPYVKLLTQLYGDRLLVANATGCSSIYGGNLPTTPYTKDARGRGPAWANSLFEDNAEFGFGMRLALDQHGESARDLLRGLATQLGDALVTELLDADQASEAGIARQRERVATLRERLAAIPRPAARRLEQLADYLVRKSVWILGGDGWAYDIGYGGLDHVIASGADVNVLVLDTELYSNTGGQVSKATPLGSAAGFAAAGKTTLKKDLALHAIAYGNVYVATVALGAMDAQTVRALVEADTYPGPSLVIAYAHCIAHGIDMSKGLERQRLAVESGHWPLLRFDPRRIAQRESPLKLDSPAPKLDLAAYVEGENRWRQARQEDPERFQAALEREQRHVRERYRMFAEMSRVMTPPPGDGRLRS
jgi:pyruvate-ferredoxin/flavodoxin oxidoreductase